MDIPLKTFDKNMVLPFCFSRVFLAFAGFALLSEEERERNADDKYCERDRTLKETASTRSLCRAAGVQWWDSGTVQGSSARLPLRWDTNARPEAVLSSSCHRATGSSSRIERAA